LNSTNPREQHCCTQPATGVCRLQEYEAHDDAKGYTRALLALLSQRQTLQSDALRSCIRLQSGAAPGAAQALQFAAAPRVSQLLSEREATQRNLCSLPALPKEPLDVDTMEGAMRLATEPLAGVSHTVTMLCTSAS
jgi:hypothetical protein